MPCKQNTAFMKKLFIPTLIAAGLSTLILTLPSCSPDEKQGSEEPLLELTSPEEMSIPAEGGNFLIQYRITNPTKDGTVTAWTDEDCEWIEDLNSRSSYGEITFNVGKNTSMGERSATVTASYENQTFEVKVTQKWSESALYDIEFEAKDITGFYYGERYSPGMGDYWFFFSDIGFDESNNFSGLPDGTYSISFDCMDDAVNPNNFYGSWTGTLNKVDMSSSVSNAKATMYQSVKSKITRK